MGLCLSAFLFWSSYSKTLLSNMDRHSYNHHKLRSILMLSYNQNRRIQSQQRQLPVLHRGVLILLILFVLFSNDRNHSCVLSFAPSSTYLHLSHSRQLLQQQQQQQQLEQRQEQHILMVVSKIRSRERIMNGPTIRTNVRNENPKTQITIKTREKVTSSSSSTKNNATTEESLTTTSTKVCPNCEMQQQEQQLLQNPAGIDTLTDIIMRLSTEERNELLEKVARRSSMQQDLRQKLNGFNQRQDELVLRDDDDDDDKKDEANKNKVHLTLLDGPRNIAKPNQPLGSSNDSHGGTSQYGSAIVDGDEVKTKPNIKQVNKDTIIEQKQEPVNVSSDNAQKYEHRNGNSDQGMRQKQAMEKSANSTPTTTTTTTTSSSSQLAMNEENMERYNKILWIMGRAKQQLEENEKKLNQAKRLFRVANWFLQQTSTVSLKEQTNILRDIPLPRDLHFGERVMYMETELVEIEEMRVMNRKELDEQRSIYLQNRIKFEKAAMKCRGKQYSASLQLARIKALEKQQQGKWKSST